MNRVFQGFFSFKFSSRRNSEEFQSYMITETLLVSRGLHFLNMPVALPVPEYADPSKLFAALNVSSLQAASHKYVSTV